LEERALLSGNGLQANLMSDLQTVTKALQGLVSGNVSQANLMSDLTQITNAEAAYERALSAAANSLVSNLTQSSNKAAAGFGTVLQTNLVSDLPGVAQLLDPNLVNPWGISQGAGGPFWTSDNNAGVSTLFNVPEATPTTVSINPLVVNIPTPVSLTGGAPTGTVRNDVGGSTFQITGPNQAGQTTSASSVFLFATEDGTIIGWNPGIDPTGKFAGPGGASTQAVIAVDNSGNNFTNPDPNQQTGAVYKGLSLATSNTPIFASDPNTTSVLYAANFRSGQIEVYNSNFQRVNLPAGAFADSNLPAGYAPFNAQVLNGKVYVTYALQDAAKHDDVGGQGHGFIDVFNQDGTPGLPNGQERLVSRGPLDSPWGLAIAPSSFGSVGGDLLVGNFKSGFIDVFNPTTGQFLGNLKDPDGEPIQIDHLWALKFGGGGAGGDPNTLYFTAGLDNEMHGLFGSLTAVAPGTPEGPAEAQKVIAAVDVFQLDLQQLIKDISSGAAQATIAQDTQTLQTDFNALVLAEQQFAQDSRQDHGNAALPAQGTSDAAAIQNLDRLFASLASSKTLSGGANAAAIQNIDQLFAAGGSFDR
jgi:uncharacterized protein (TIGR03118 family)